MRTWPYMRDEEGRPRRFLSHREVLSWATRRVIRFVGPLTVLGVVGGLGRGFIRSRESAVTENVLPELLRYVVYAVAVSVVAGLVLGSLVAAAMYLYVALSGGVMDQEARRRYREERAVRLDSRASSDYLGRRRV